MMGYTRCVGARIGEVGREGDRLGVVCVDLSQIYREQERGAGNQRG